jgi:hypothetical protein
MKLLLIFILLLDISCAYAFDESNAGRYAVIRYNGHITDFIFRISQTDYRWKLERKAPDGSWEDVTCSPSCTLEVSNKEDIECIVGTKIPKDISIECIHNNAFAFCSAGKMGQKKRAYLLIGLMQQPVIWVPLFRLEDDGIEP